MPETTVELATFALAAHPPVGWTSGLPRVTAGPDAAMPWRGSEVPEPWAVAVLVTEAASSVAETHGRTGREREAAVAVGVEGAVRLHDALGPALLRAGWDPAGPGIVCGSAMAAGRLLGLDAGQVAMALGVACTQAAGLAAERGTPVGDFQRSRAVANGVEAAYLVRGGMSAPRTGLEGRRGLVALMAPGADLERVVDGLGRRWLAAEVLRGTAHPTVRQREA
jgi:2-methylcitrate dehydratase PrpD